MEVTIGRDGETVDGRGQESQQETARQCGCSPTPSARAPPRSARQRRASQSARPQIRLTTNGNVRVQQAA